LKAFVTDAAPSRAAAAPRTRDPTDHPARVPGGAAPGDVDIAGILIDANGGGLEKIGRLSWFLADVSVDHRPGDSILLFDLVLEIF
jgi:hypothetical protein